MNKITGVVEKVWPAEKIPTQKGEFEKQEVVLVVDGKYPNYIPIELTGDQIGSFGEGDQGRKAEVSFFINGRKGKGQYADRVFVSLRYADHSFVEDASEPEQDDGAENNLPF